MIETTLARCEIGNVLVALFCWAPERYRVFFNYGGTDNGYTYDGPDLIAARATFHRTIDVVLLGNHPVRLPA